jgi:heme exporter protein A
MHAAPGVPGPPRQDQARGAAEPDIEYFQGPRYRVETGSGLDVRRSASFETGVRGRFVDHSVASSPSSGGPARLLAHGLACRRNGRLLFAGLDVTLEPGAALVLVGPNGVGKTSLLRVLAGLLRPEAGTIRFEPDDGETDLAQRSVFISARDALKPAFTVSELIASWRDIVFAGESAGGEARALEALDLAALADIPCGYLSSGQRRRLSLSRLLLARTELRPLWLLDEPTNALDRAARARLAAIVARHRAAGGVVVAATHDPLDWPDAATLDLAAHRASHLDTAA